ncbi:MAG: GntR family transcriptional regulator [Burkholderiaceae bacterium]|nr:GntR family transcriptional regulator [Microbacteriaceae bacterium]
MNAHSPIFVQIAEQIENDILSGVLAEETQVPSTNDYAVSHRINPATVGKGMRLLAEEEYIYKRRGVGMFVSPGAKARIAAGRRETFAHRFVGPLVAEATKLGIAPDEVRQMVADAAAHPADDGVSLTAGRTRAEYSHTEISRPPRLQIT